MRVRVRGKIKGKVWVRGGSVNEGESVREEESKCEDGCVGEVSIWLWIWMMAKARP